MATKGLCIIKQLAFEQRWSRGHRARGQGQGHNKCPRPRPRTEPLEAKDRNARSQGQGHRRKRSPKKKSLQNFFQAFSNSLAHPEFLIRGGLNHKSHEMTSSKFFQRGSFCGTKILWDGRSEIVVACLHVTRTLQRKKA